MSRKWRPRWRLKWSRSKSKQCIVTSMQTGRGGFKFVVEEFFDFRADARYQLQRCSKFDLPNCGGLRWSSGSGAHNFRRLSTVLSNGSHTRTDRG